MGYRYESMTWHEKVASLEKLIAKNKAKLKKQKAQLKRFKKKADGT